MRICGFQKTTLLDYPQHVAATVFVGGCNFRCPFCHNKDLVLGKMDQAVYTENQILQFLEKRKDLLEGICITGGEPTLQPDLEEFICKARNMGYLVKLDTNGYRPEILERLLGKDLLDYVAMDVKASPHNYARVTGVPVDVDRILKSIQLLKNCRIPYEFRTTVVKGLHEIEEFEEIVAILKGSKSYALQGYRDNENVIAKGLSAFSREEMRHIEQIARKYIDNVYLRGVE